MYQRIFLLFALSVAIFSCKKEEKMYRNAAVITGIDKRLCPCAVSCPCVCGGLLFHFTDTTYQQNIPLDNPSIFSLPANAQFPIYMDVNWVNTTRCGITAVTITGYKIR